MHHQISWWLHGPVRCGAGYRFLDAELRTKGAVCNRGESNNGSCWGLQEMQAWDKEEGRRLLWERTRICLWHGMKGPSREHLMAWPAKGITDLCQFGLRVPRGDFLRKRTRLRGTKEVIKHATKRCQGTHKHQPVLGGMKFQGKWMNIFLSSLVATRPNLPLPSGTVLKDYLK